MGNFVQKNVEKLGIDKMPKYFSKITFGGKIFFLFLEFALTFKNNLTFTQLTPEFSLFN